MLLKNMSLVLITPGSHYKTFIQGYMVKRIFVRESYRYIESIIYQEVHQLARESSTSAKKTIVTGTRGIGKSIFLIYLLCKLVKAGKRVLFLYWPYQIYYDGQGRIYHYDQLPSPTDHAFWAPDLWCLFDEQCKNVEFLSKIPYNSCTLILSTYPRQELVKDFMKPPRPLEFYMPIWSELEMETIAPIFPKSYNWKSRFEILGGVPAYVLESTEHDPTEIFENAGCVYSIEECTKTLCLDTLGIWRDIHHLIHMTSVEPYRKCTLEYASKKALSIVAHIKRFEVCEKISTLLHYGNWNPLAVEICKVFFEKQFYELLEEGGTFTCYRLDGSEMPLASRETTITIPSSEEQLIAGKIDSRQALNELYVPTRKDYHFDAWIRGIGAFKMTVGKNIQIRNSAKGDLELLGNGANKVFWLLPSRQYKPFTKQSSENVEEYALLIPYPTAVY